ncbi:phenylalanine-tRNA ligase [Batrachochytrium salamandrivorans]|nr:phenylalanine-tRNA ligase [Batrachochytrium salamandrivorans]
MLGWIGKRLQSTLVGECRRDMGKLEAMTSNGILEMLQSPVLDLKTDEELILTALRRVEVGNRPLLLNTLESLLQRKRTQRLQSTIQEIQTENFGVNNSSELFATCSHLLSKVQLPPQANSPRDQFARCKRLLLFAPYRQDFFHESSMKTYIAELAQQDLLFDYDKQPLACLKQLIEQFVFPEFQHFSGFLCPQVSTEQNFDDMLIPNNHISRSKSDTFYLTSTELLRTHTSAHQTEFLRQGHTQFLLSGDVFRRDEIDRTHFPVFHQMEGVKLFPPGTPKHIIFDDLKHTLDQLAVFLFPKVTKKNWMDCYFPFTNPSLELEIEYNGKLVELLGSGVIQPEILHNKCGLHSEVNGWAFGLGLDRLAMLLFDIPDVRLFWSKDERFVSQFHGCFQHYINTHQHVQFQPFTGTKHEAKSREISMWIGEANFHVNDFFNLVRDVAGDAVEEVMELEGYLDSKTGRKSKLFKVIFRSEFRELDKREVAQWMKLITTGVESQLGVKVR